MIYAVNSVRWDDVGAIEFIIAVTKIIKDSVDVTASDDGKGSTYYRRHFISGEMSFVLFGLQGFRSDLAGTNRQLMQL